MAGAAALQVRSLRAGYGRLEVLHGIDLVVGDREVVALIGANGAGKTTLMRAICGLIPGVSGTITLRGEDMARLTPDRRVQAGLSQVLEGRQVFGPLSVETNLTLGGYRRPQEVPRNLERMYAMFPVLKTKRRQPAATLSGGQQQMLAMARALMNEPRVLLLDEPSMGLAPLLVQEIFAVIVSLRDAGVPILLVEQNARAALAISSRAYVMETGRIVITAPSEQLLDDDRVRQAYLGH